jgi:hypothetical protein
VDVAEPVPSLRERALELFERTCLVDSRVHEHDPVTRADSVCVDVRDARPWKRKPQAPHTAQHTVGTPELPSSVRLVHGGEATSAASPVSLILRS